MARTQQSTHHLCDRRTQRKLIKYNHLVTNLLIYHNVVNRSRVLATLALEEHQVTLNALPLSARIRLNISTDTEMRIVKAPAEQYARAYCRGSPATTSSNDPESKFSRLEIIT